VISLSELTLGELAAYIAEHLRSKGIETGSATGSGLTYGHLQVSESLL